MLWTALEDPDPVLIFEHGSLHNVAGELADAKHLEQAALPSVERVVAAAREVVGARG